MPAGADLGAERRGAQRAGRAFEEAHAEAALDAGHDPAHLGLVEVQPGRRGGEAVAVPELEENAQFERRD